MEKWNELNPQEKKVLVRFYKDEAFKDNDWNIRISAYRYFGFTEKAFKDNDYDIRLSAYRSLGFTEEALNDDNYGIRLEAYRSLGFTEEALRDDSWLIRDEAIIYLNHMKTKKVTIELTQDQLDKIKHLI